MSDPKGNPEAIRQIARDYVASASAVNTVRHDLGRTARRGIPEIWTGTAGEKASEVVVAVARDLDHMSSIFGQAGNELRFLADDIEGAKKLHSDGISALRTADSMLEDADSLFDYLLPWDESSGHAKTGVQNLLAAIDKAEDAGRRFTNFIHQLELAKEARAFRLVTGNLTDDDRLVLSDAAIMPTGPHDKNEILSPNDLARAGQNLDRLSQADRAAYEKLLAQAKSPQERAYVMKALAAGYSLPEINGFAASIHVHGDDPAWLQQHLAPLYTPTDSEVVGDKSTKLSFMGAEWSQYHRNNFVSDWCIAATTIMGRAKVDPLYALQLTTGGHPGDPVYDSPGVLSAPAGRAGTSELA